MATPIKKAGQYDARVIKRKKRDKPKVKQSKKRNKREQTANKME